jgi:hypothetical protein
MISSLLLMAFLGFTAPTVEDFYNSTINRSVVIGRTSSGGGIKSFPISRGVVPHDYIERRRNTCIFTVITFKKGKRHELRRVFEK